MEKVVESLEKAYQALVAAAAYVFETKEASEGAKTPSTEAALDNFKHHWELFKVSCDHAEEFIDSVRQRIGSECLVDEATGSLSLSLSHSTTTNVGIPPISAVRLEAMSKAVRWLVIELQQGANPNCDTNINPNPNNPNSASPASASASHTPSGTHPGGGAFDARFGDDSAQ